MSNPLPALIRHLNLPAGDPSALPSSDIPQSRWLLWSLVLAGLACLCFWVGLGVRRKARSRRPALW